MLWITPASLINNRWTFGIAQIQGSLGSGMSLWLLFQYRANIMSFGNNLKYSLVADTASSRLRRLLNAAMSGSKKASFKKEPTSRLKYSLSPSYSLFSGQSLPYCDMQSGKQWWLSCRLSVMETRLQGIIAYKLAGWHEFSLFVPLNTTLPNDLFGWSAGYTNSIDLIQANFGFGGVVAAPGLWAPGLPSACCSIKPAKNCDICS